MSDRSDFQPNGRNRGSDVRIASRCAIHFRNTYHPTIRSHRKRIGQNQKTPFFMVHIPSWHSRPSIAIPLADTFYWPPKIIHENAVIKIEQPNFPAPIDDNNRRFQNSMNHVARLHISHRKDNFNRNIHSSVRFSKIAIVSFCKLQMTRQWIVLPNFCHLSCMSNSPFPNGVTKFDGRWITDRPLSDSQVIHPSAHSVCFIPDTLQSLFTISVTIVHMPRPSSLSLQNVAAAEFGFAINEFRWFNRGM
jgi:hypothetical protein